MTEFDDLIENSDHYDDASEWLDALCSHLDSDIEQSPDRLVCDACEEQFHDELYDVCIDGAEYRVCEKCRDLLTDDIEQYHWWNRLSEAHYTRAAEYLRSRDEIWCVHDHAYTGGEMWVHTPYCSATVVNDVCDHFGFRIRWFQIVEPGDREFDCLDDHGPCIEINLDYNNRVRDPFPLEHDILDDRSYYDADYVDESDKLFERDDE